MFQVSIIVPCYKRVNQTLKTLDLLLASHGKDTDFELEIIVADSSSDDNLKQSILKRYKDKARYIRPEKPGIAANKNAGARLATHEILIFCDSDMEVEPDTLQNTFIALKKHKTAGAIGGQVIWKGGSKDGTLDRPRKEDRILTNNDTTYIEALYSRYIATYKNVFWDVGGYDEEVFNMRGEGSDLSIRYWRAGYPLAYDDTIRVHHVHDTEGGIIRGVAHPEWGIAKDLLLLAYKYNIDDKNKNFMQTVAANFEAFKNDGYYRILEGIKNNYEFITYVKPIIDRQKKDIKINYNFKFLEIFSEHSIFLDCINDANTKLTKIKNNL